MSLPEREQYYLDEAQPRLGISARDLQYYLCHGELKASVWLHPRRMEYAELGLAVEGEYNYCGVRTFGGYAALSPSSCRALLMWGWADVDSFYDPWPSVRLQPYSDTEGTHAIRMLREEMVISREECERFIVSYGPDDEMMRGPGRPSLMPEIMAEHRRRYQAGEHFKHAGREAQALTQWAESRFPGDVIPTQKTVRNHLAQARKNLPDTF